MSLSQVEGQLKRVGCNFRFWGRGEIRELRKVLTADEVIQHCVNGRYENGFAMLVATNQRLLLIDHKPMFVAIEDIRYDMIAEIDFSFQLFMGIIRVITPGRPLRFLSWSQYHLREVLKCAQAHMQELRQHYTHEVQYSNMRLNPANDWAGILLGGLAMQTAGPRWPQTLPVNPYAQTVLTRRRAYPRFY
jgi:hypothetical protein